ncbi:TetR/AcrR family transcriptional regulator [Isoptericola sp. BMS4]|uniref:TetR/AcrR family transcriptional regulator n=1 Tax=Isoptericola sp. BMS4 TaxID=2527875 RepID=UPI00141F2611|nr:TetR family transcriptional regulator [Isoptericola sp. BMS4]
MSEQERRSQIVEAVERVMARDGVDAVTMRAVAAEAGVSLRLVQYYGKSKDELLLTALHHMSDRSVRHWHDLIAAAGDDSRKALRAFFDAALPTDPQSRAFHRLGVSLEQLAIADPDGVGAVYQNHLRQLADALVPHLRTTEGLGRERAYEVMALSHGLGTLVMTDVLTPEQARWVAAAYLDR